MQVNIDTVDEALEHLKLPPRVAELYIAHRSMDNEFYLGSFTFRSLSSMMREATIESYACLTMAVSYANRHAARRYVYNPIDDMVTQELEEDIEWIGHVDDFIQRVLSDARAQAIRNENAYRSKCVRGRFIPSPELHPTCDNDQM